MIYLVWSSFPFHYVVLLKISVCREPDYDILCSFTTLFIATNIKLK